MTSIQSLPLYLFDEISEHLPIPTEDSYYTRGILKKADLDGGVFTEIVSLSSCNKRLRNLLFPLVFRSIGLGQPLETRSSEYLDELKWMLSSKSRVLATAQHVCVRYLLPASFKDANACLSKMKSLCKYVHCSTRPILQLFLSTLQNLPRFSLINMNGCGVESFPSILELVPKIASLEIQLYRQSVKPLDCLEFCPRTLSPEDSTDAGSQPSIVTFRRAIIDNLARLLNVAGADLQVLYLDVPAWKRDDFGTDWWEAAVRQSKLSSSPISLPSLKRLYIENAHFTPALLKEVLEAAPHLSHLALSKVRKPEAEMLAPARPLLKTLNVFFQDCTKRYPVFLSSLTAGATLEHAYLNGITPIDLVDFIKSPNFCSALSLRTLRILFDSDKPLRPDHFDKLAKTCLNLNEFDFEGSLEADPSKYFAVLSQLPNLVKITMNDPWDSRAVNLSPLLMHDGRYIRSEEMGSFRVISCRNNSVNDEIRSRIREDLDGVRPLYVKRFCAIARAHRSLQTIVWTPTAEVTWVWTFFRNGDKLTFKEKATIDYDQGPQADVPQSAVLMLA